MDDVENSSDIYIQKLPYSHLLYLLTNLCGLVADSLILYVILRYKFWKVPAYTSILNWTIVDTLRHLAALVMQLIAGYNCTFPVNKLVLNLDIACFVTTPIILIVLILTNTKFFKSYYVISNIFAWVLIIALYIAYTVTLFDFPPKYLFHLITYSILAVYLPSLAANLIICIVIFVKKTYLRDTYTKLELVLVATYVTYWVVCILFIINTILCKGCIERIVPIALVFMIAATNAIANIYILQKIDSRFKKCLYSIFSCNAKPYDDFTDSDVKKPLC